MSEKSLRKKPCNFFSFTPQPTLLSPVAYFKSWSPLMFTDKASSSPSKEKSNTPLNAIGHSKQRWAPLWPSSLSSSLSATSSTSSTSSQVSTLSFAHLQTSWTTRSPSTHLCSPRRTIRQCWAWSKLRCWARSSDYGFDIAFGAYSDIDPTMGEVRAVHQIQRQVLDPATGIYSKNEE